jgi:hypothetical protein
VDANGQVSCIAYQYFPAGSAECECTDPGRKPVAALPASITDSVYKSGQCASDPCCQDLCFCELVQLSGAELTTCQNETAPSPEPAGWCYVDPSQGAGSADLVASCPPGEQRQLRVLGIGASYSLAVSCQGAVL